MTDHDSTGPEAEIGGLKRKASAFATAHATLRDRYRFRSRLIEIVSLISSAWLVSLAFSDRAMVNLVLPWVSQPNIFIGALGVTVFCLTLLQFATRWGARADAHGLALENYASITKSARRLLNDIDSLDAAELSRLRDQYEFVNANSIEIPERQFLALKQRHLVKVEISKKLDNRPGLNLLLTRLAIYWRDFRDSDG
ncbi:hypothetical protein [Maricaulis sp.]|uniref:hypothetical protein n=1 Tax=Maricaulis sp. TaxID=1486257 RepID=UPI000C43AD0D|nr:hypothetical protein [Maricaulis sp.]MAC89374.1 hypothetical protein [Maricaulis sp.]